MAKRYKRPLPMWDNYPLEANCLNGSQSIEYAENLPRISGKQKGAWITDDFEIDRILEALGRLIERFHLPACMAVFTCGDVWVHFNKQPRKLARGRDSVFYVGNLADARFFNPNQLQLSFSN